eukprot:8818754-Pyramimonas_sp.AAC.1
MASQVSDRGSSFVMGPNMTELMAGDHCPSPADIQEAQRLDDEFFAGRSAVGADTAVESDDAPLVVEPTWTSPKSEKR